MTASEPPPQANPPVRRGRMPDTPGAFVLASLRMGWRWLTRMRTALYLLGLLGLETLLATVVPQEPNVPATVADWRAGRAGPGTAVSQVVDALGGYDVYGSPAFLALLLLLFISLTACLLRRYPALWRVATRSRPPATRYLDSQDHVGRFRTDRDPAAAVASARGQLDDRRWRLAADDTAPGRAGDDAAQVAAEKGHVLREGGSLLFHTSFYLLLIGVVAGQLFGFTAQIGIVEGQPGFTDSAVAYSTWSYDPGRLFGPEDHPGFGLRLDEFDVSWYRDPGMGGRAREYVSHVTVTGTDGGPREESLRPNVPLVVQGLRIHQLDWGYAPRVVVRAGGEVVHDGFLQLQRGDSGLFTGAVKAPGAQPDVGLDLTLVPYAPTGEDGRPTITGAPWAEAPLLAFTAYRGDLQMEANQSLSTLRTGQLREAGTGVLRPGEQTQPAEDVTVSFPELRRWSGLQVSDKPTLGLLLAAGGLVLVGLITALYAYRRRLWVQAEPDPDSGRTLVTVAGRAFQRPHVFEDEFDDLAETVRDAVGSDTPAPPAGDRRDPPPDGGRGPAGPGRAVPQTVTAESVAPQTDDDRTAPT